MANGSDEAVRREAEMRLEAMFRRHYRPVASYVSRRADPGIVEDIVAETFLVAWRRLKDVPEDELPWLLGVASNTLATQRRSSARRGTLLLKLSALTAPAEVLPTSGGTDNVSQALDKLSAADREAITLIAWDELAPREAAKVVGQSAAAFRVRLHRAKRRLKEELERSSAAPMQPCRRIDDVALPEVSTTHGGFPR
jgi:RNA polymerase sigma-70 factor (ECF subfamily)